MDPDPALSNSSASKGDESSLKSSLCFFCLSSEDDIKCNDYQLSLRNITRYLHLSNYDNTGNIKLCNVEEKPVWYICNQCSSIATEFNALYHLGEEIKLRLNWCLDKVQNVMTKAEEDDSQVKTPMEMENDDAWNMRGTLRAAMKGRTKGSTPHVRIFKTPVPEKEPISSFMELDDCHHDMDAMDSGAEEYHDCKNDSPEIKQAIAPPLVKPQIKKEFDAMDDEAPQESIKLPIKFQKKKLKCSFCRAEFQQGKGQGEWSRRLHVVQYHGDQLFPNSKLDFVTDSQFKKIIGGLLFKDLIKERCVYCKKRFTIPKKKKASHVSQIKRHLVKNHFEMVQQKLMKIQANPDVFKSLMECDSMGEVCDCGAYLQNASSRARHNTWHCPVNRSDNQLQNPPKLPGTLCHTNLMSDFVMVSNKFLCKSCKKTFSDRCSAVKHWQYYCPVKKGKRPLIKREADTLICEYCGHECVRRGPVVIAKHAMKQHLVQKHPEHYFPTFSKGRNHEQLKAILERALFPKFAVKSKRGIPSSCSLCGKKFRRKYWLRTHLINKHIHQLKENLKLILEDDDATLLVQVQEENDLSKQISLKSVVPAGRSMKIEETTYSSPENTFIDCHDNKESDAIDDFDPFEI